MTRCDYTSPQVIQKKEDNNQKKHAKRVIKEHVKDETFLGVLSTKEKTGCIKDTEA